MEQVQRLRGLIKNATKLLTGDKKIRAVDALHAIQQLKGSLDGIERGGRPDGVLTANLQYQNAFLQIEDKSLLQPCVWTINAEVNKQVRLLMERLREQTKDTINYDFSMCMERTTAIMQQQSTAIEQLCQQVQNLGQEAAMRREQWQNVVNTWMALGKELRTHVKEVNAATDNIKSRTCYLAEIGQEAMRAQQLYGKVRPLLQAAKALDNELKARTTVSGQLQKKEETIRHQIHTLHGSIAITAKYIERSLKILQAAAVRGQILRNSLSLLHNGVSDIGAE